VTFEQAIEIEAEPGALFALTQDYARRRAWDPFLRSAALVGGARAPGVGVRAWCVARTGVGMETEYLAYDPPRVAAVRMTRHFARDTGRRLAALKAYVERDPNADAGAGR